MKRHQYMHTLNRQPAHFDGEQIIYRDPRRKVRLVPSLAQVRREQRVSEAWRRRQGWKDIAVYSYMKVLPIA